LGSLHASIQVMKRAASAEFGAATERGKQVCFKALHAKMSSLGFCTWTALTRGRDAA